MFLVRVGMNIIYSFIKLCKVKKRITLISRMNNDITLDMALLKKELETNTDYEIIFLSKKLGKGLFNKLKYILFIFKKMYYIATSKIVIIDSYIISISLLKHKKKTTIIQMWHALGAFKQFGYSIINKEEGSNYKLAQKMKMHHNYDIVTCSSSNCIEPYSEAFNVSNSKIGVYLLPRVKYLIDNNTVIKNQILTNYPLLNNGKKNILYAPTFRKDGRNYYSDIVNQIDYETYNFIITKHYGFEEIYINNQKVYSQPNQFHTTWLTVADYIITDYSAIMYDAMLLNKPLYFYIPDFEKYDDARGFYFDYTEKIPGFYSENIKELLTKINLDYDYTKYNQLKSTYLNLNSPSISDLIYTKLKENDYEKL